MTPEQQTQVTQLRTRIKNMRAGGRTDAQIRAGLIAEGWPAGAVVEAIGGNKPTKTVEQRVNELRKQAEGIKDARAQTMALMLLVDLDRTLEQNWPEGYPTLDSRVHPGE